MKALLVITLSLAGTLAIACQDAKAPPVVAGPSAADSADQVIFGMRTLLTNRGVKRGELFADTAYVYDDQNRYDLRNARAEFMQENGAPSGTMRANRGKYNLRTQELEGWGNVVVTMVDGRTLKTPHVVYRQLTNEISSDTTYELAQGDRVQHGGAFKADPNFTHLTCLKRCGASAPVAIPNP